MRKQLFIYLTAGTLACFAPAIMAQSSTSSSESTPAAADKAAQRRHDHQEMMRILGLSREDLKGLSKEERQTKISEALKAKLSELKEKKANGTITEKEEKDLAFLKAHAPHHKKAETNS